MCETILEFHCADLFHRAARLNYCVQVATGVFFPTEILCMDVKAESSVALSNSIFRQSMASYLTANGLMRTKNCYYALASSFRKAKVKLKSWSTWNALFCRNSLSYQEHILTGSNEINVMIQHNHTELKIAIYSSMKKVFGCFIRYCQSILSNKNEPKKTTRFWVESMFQLIYSAIQLDFCNSGSNQWPSQETPFFRQSLRRSGFTTTSKLLSRPYHSYSVLQQPWWMKILTAR